MTTTNPQPARGSADASAPGRASAVGHFLSQAQRALLTARFIGHADVVSGHRD